MYGTWSMQECESVVPEWAPRTDPTCGYGGRRSRVGTTEGAPHRARPRPCRPLRHNETLFFFQDYNITRIMSVSYNGTRSYLMNNFNNLFRRRVYLIVFHLHIWKSVN